MKIHGKEWKRREIEARVGRIDQLGGIRRLRATEGVEAGVETVQIVTGSGLEYFVNPSRGLDISACRLAGSSVSWQSAQGDVAPSFYSDRGTDWLRTACGGMLMTCGLRQVGAPCEDEGESLGQHGRVHHAPARQVAAEGLWEGDEYRMRIRGELAETKMFGEHLVLQRSLESRMGENVIRLHDVVENRGFTPSPLMLLYHFNFGFPMLSPGMEFHFPAQRIEPRDEHAPPVGYDRWETPTEGFHEQCYYHSEFVTDEEGFTRVAIVNPSFPVAGRAVPVRASIRWRPEQLPWMVQWKMCGQGMHVLGLEPANCRVAGRAAARAANELDMLDPGESRCFETRLDFEFLA